MSSDLAPGLPVVTDADDRSGVQPVAPVVDIGRAKSASGRHRWGNYQMVSKGQFAEIEDVSTKTVERWMHAGLPFEKYGERRNSRVRIPLVRGQAWVRNVG